MLEAKILYMVENLKINCWVWYETCYIPCISMVNMASLTSFPLFHVIFELLGHFMVIISIVQIKLISATESCLLSIFSIRNYFYRQNYSFYHPIPISSGSRDLDITWKKILCSILISNNINSFAERVNEWYLQVALSAKLSSWKKGWQLFVFVKAVPSSSAFNAQQLKKSSNVRSFYNIKNFALISFYKWKKKKWKNEFLWL